MIPNINLLAHTGKSESKSKIIYTLAASIVLVLALFAGLFISANGELNKFNSKQISLQEQKLQLLSEHESSNQPNTGTIEQALAFVERISYPVSPLMGEVSRLLPLGTYLRSYTFAEANVTIKADFVSISSASEYIALLEESEYFNDVRVQSILSFDLGTDQVMNSDNNLNRNNSWSRYSAEIVLNIDTFYLAAGGDN